jgi:uncharacterized protein (DUF2141 family)
MNTPWYREPCPWLLMSGPAAVLVAGAATTWIAFASADGLVAEDYYKQRLAINKRLAREQAAERAGISAQVEFEPGKIRVRLKGGAPEALFVHLAHATRANLPASAFAQSSCPGIHVKILSIRNSTGTVACALFESPAGFLAEFLHFATNIVVIKVRDTQARCDFAEIAPGAYALAVIHDENMNGKLDTNWLGIPTEGYGFSNDAKALFSAPSFSVARFPYDGRTLDLTINLHY